jgi:MoxR-vWA-beta-propeller ternary system domain bpX4
MSFASFLRSLFENGRASAPPFGPLSASDLSEGDRVLSEFEAIQRLDLPGEPPVFDAIAGRWAAISFFRACQFVVYRDLPTEELARELSNPCPRRRSPAVDYSVDLVIRFLPDLLTLARSAAEKDPLVDHLRAWAKQWPLSSVGVAGLESLDCSSFIDHPALLALYTDRILARGDANRLSEQRVRQAIEQAVGMYHTLAGSLASLLTHPTTEESPP